MRQLTDQDIYKYFLGDLVIGDMYNSPIPGRKDDTPSFCVYEKEKDVLRWVDHGLTNQFGNKPENLVQYLRGLPLTVPGYYAAKNIIETEVRIGMMGTKPTQLRSRPKYDQPPYLNTGGFRDWEHEYWNRFELSESELRYESLEALHSMGWNNNDPIIVSKPGDPAFVYWWQKNPTSAKLYRPETSNRRDKFRQFNVDGVIEGWDQMILEFEALNGNLFDVLVVGSSSKDRIVVKKSLGTYNGKPYSGFNPRGEKDRMDIITKAPLIKSMAKRVVCLYDADDPGFNGAKTMAELTDFEFFDTRGKLLGQKDFADIKDSKKGNQSYSVVKEIIFNLIT